MIAGITDFKKRLIVLGVTLLLMATAVVLPMQFTIADKAQVKVDMTADVVISQTLVTQNGITIIINRGMKGEVK